MELGVVARIPACYIGEVAPRRHSPRPHGRNARIHSRSQKVLSMPAHQRTVGSIALLRGSFNDLVGGRSPGIGEAYARRAEKPSFPSSGSPCTNAPDPCWYASIIGARSDVDIRSPLKSSQPTLQMAAVTRSDRERGVASRPVTAKGVRLPGGGPPIRARDNNPETRNPPTRKGPGGFLHCVIPDSGPALGGFVESYAVA